MSVNRNKPHLLVLPEDDANRQLVNGFAMYIPSRCSRAFQRLPIAGGWIKVVEKFESQYITKMRQNPNTYLVLVLDFDGNADDSGSRDRRSEIESKIPSDLKEKVFILGVSSEPEALRRSASKSFETIGAALAMECDSGGFELWHHSLLSHNKDEVSRIHPFIKQHILREG